MADAANSMVPWGPTLNRNLCDKMYDKRKLAAQDIEKIVRDLHPVDDRDRLNNIITYLVDNFCQSPNAHNRKGGLIAMAAIAIGLGVNAYKFLSFIVPPIFRCLSDQEPRVRYYACESIYNIAKICRQRLVFSYFPELFDILSRLYADPDVSVHNAAQFLDNLIKDIAGENQKKIDIAVLTRLIKEKINVTNQMARLFLLGWIDLIITAPELGLLIDPEVLGGMFFMLSNSNKDIIEKVNNSIQQAFREILKCPDPIPCGPIIAILINNCRSMDDLTKLTALNLMNEFLLTRSKKADILFNADQIISAVLPNISHEPDPEVQREATKVNKSLQALVEDSPELELAAVEKIARGVKDHFRNLHEATKVAALNWIILLENKFLEHIEPLAETLIESSMPLLSDQSETVLRLLIEMWVRLATKDHFFERLMELIIDHFYENHHFLEPRGSVILRGMGKIIQPEKIFSVMAKILQQREGNLGVTSVIIQHLNIILLTTPEMKEMRKKLKNSLQAGESRELFVSLYRSWCHDPISTLSLCFLVGAYEHTYKIILQLSELECDIKFLLNMDKLVRLIESPVFTTTRMHLLEPEKYPFLLKSLYGVLMILPQSAVFEKLRTRLTSVATIGQLHLMTEAKKNLECPKCSADDVPFDDLLQHFVQVQTKGRKRNTPADSAGGDHSTRNGSTGDPE
eukprot:TRINITY_DN2790_c0_g3_i1.p1 TRINITY_DN2790_c0_g3~~TRINITY_DN2790_c0_g3_i1.p1  ORF type:complete len:708 (-),score=278.57 TRINITY_DN2790_c0_g3_i1:3212-5269(-)